MQFLDFFADVDSVSLVLEYFFFQFVELLKCVDLRVHVVATIGTYLGIMVDQRPSAAVAYLSRSRQLNRLLGRLHPPFVRDLLSQLIDLLPQVIDDGLLLSHMRSHQLFVGSGLHLDVLGSVGLLQCVARTLR